MKRKTVGNRGGRFRTVKEETAHYNAVLIEDIKDQFKFVAEKVGGMEESLMRQMAMDKSELKQDIADTRDALGIRIDRVETGLTRVESSLKKEIAEVKAELSNARSELSDTRTELSEKIDRIHDIVASHDEAITLLKAAQ